MDTLTGTLDTTQDEVDVNLDKNYCASDNSVIKTMISISKNEYEPSVIPGSVRGKEPINKKKDDLDKKHQITNDLYKNLE